MQAKPQNPAPSITTVDGARIALRGFFNICKEWGLNAAQEQTLIGASRTTYFAWKANNVRSALDGAVLERLSYIFRIYAALEILIPIPERATAWVKASNTAPLFGGGTALERMLGGKVGDLLVVADYLDAMRGGDFA